MQQGQSDVSTLKLPGLGRVRYIEIFSKDQRVILPSQEEKEKKCLTTINQAQSKTKPVSRRERRGREAKQTREIQSTTVNTCMRAYTHRQAGCHGETGIRKKAIPHTSPFKKGEVWVGYPL